MATFFTLVAHACIVVAALLMIFFAFRMIADAPSTVERQLRIMAFGAGLLLFAGARAANVNVATLLVSSINVLRPVRTGAVHVVAPALAGTFAAWFLLRGLRDRKSMNRAVRLIVMFSTFFIVLFGDVYVAAASTDTVGGNPHLLPNVSFALAGILYAIVTWDTPAPTPDVSNWRDEV